MTHDEVYRRGPVTLYLGDAREILPTLRREDFAGAVADFPYGISWESGWTPDGSKIHGDADTSLRDFVLAWAGTMSVACFGSWKVPAPAGAKGRVVWDKGHAVGMGDLSFPWFSNAEDCYLLGDGWTGTRRDCVIRCRRPFSGTSHHPHEKPVELLVRIMETMPPGRILDPCAGSGSSALAALELGREWTGIELDPKHYETAVERIDRELDQGRMFG